MGLISTQSLKRVFINMNFWMMEYHYIQRSGKVIAKPKLCNNTSITVHVDSYITKIKVVNLERIRNKIAFKYI